MERAIKTSHGEVFVRDSNERDLSPPLLLIHGFGESGEVWDSMLKQLSAKRRVVRVDLLGHGNSEKPNIAYAVSEQARSLLDVLDALAIDSAHVVAHSAGGDIVVAMIEQSAERVRSATLLGTAPDLKFVHKSIAASLMLVPGIGRVMWSLATDDALRDGLNKAFAPNSAPPPDVYIRSLRRLTYKIYVRSLSQIEAFKKQKNLCARMTGKSVPTFVIFGAEDRWVDPAAADMWAKEIGARVERLNGIGHTHMAEAPDETAKLILEFVERK